MSYTVLESSKKILTAYRRTLSYLREQEAKFDSSFLPSHIKHNINDTLDSIQGIKNELKGAIVEKTRRLQQLKLKEARYGINTPPEIVLEIEDLTGEIQAINAFLEQEFNEPDVPPATQYI